LCQFEHLEQVMNYQERVEFGLAELVHFVQHLEYFLCEDKLHVEDWVLCDDMVEVQFV